jgi:hypothetical protein
VVAHTVSKCFYLLFSISGTRIVSEAHSRRSRSDCLSRVSVEPFQVQFCGLVLLNRITYTSNSFGRVSPERFVTLSTCANSSTIYEVLSRLALLRVLLGSTLVVRSSGFPETDPFHAHVMLLLRLYECNGKSHRRHWQRGVNRMAALPLRLYGCNSRSPYHRVDSTPVGVRMRQTLISAGRFHSPRNETKDGKLEPTRWVGSTGSRSQSPRSSRKLFLPAAWSFRMVFASRKRDMPGAGTSERR